MIFLKIIHIVHIIFPIFFYINLVFRGFLNGWRLCIKFVYLKKSSWTLCRPIDHGCFLMIRARLWLYLSPHSTLSSLPHIPYSCSLRYTIRTADHAILNISDICNFVRWLWNIEICYMTLKTCCETVLECCW